MRLKSISVKNLRIYGDEEQTIEFDDNKNITVLLGNNGSGKTSLLYGCSVLFSQYTGSFPGTSRKSFTQDDIRNESTRRKADYMHFGITLKQTHPDRTEYMPFDPSLNMELVSADMFLKGNQTRNVPESRLKAIKDYSFDIKNRLDNGERISLPVLAYYGTERGQIKAVERRRDFNDIFPRWDIYKPDALESATDFKRFFTWYERNEDIERREQIQRKDLSYTSGVLDAVRRALEQLFSHLVRPRVETAPLRFVMDDMSNPDKPIEQRIERMSDGYRITVALVADIAARMAEANPSVQCSGLEDPLQASGIVLIDEIDLHLHPSLQRNILRRLNQIFPNVQFIVTTHSPNVVIGALELVQIVKLEHGTIDSDVDTSQYERYDVSLLLLSDLFDVDNVRTEEFKALEEEEERLLDKEILTSDELKRLKELTRLLTAYGYSDGKER